MYAAQLVCMYDAHKTNNKLVPQKKQNKTISTCLRSIFKTVNRGTSIPLFHFFILAKLIAFSWFTLYFQQQHIVSYYCFMLIWLTPVGQFI